MNGLNNNLLVKFNRFNLCRKRTPLSKAKAVTVVKVLEIVEIIQSFAPRTFSNSDRVSDIQTMK